MECSPYSTETMEEIIRTVDSQEADRCTRIFRIQRLAASLSDKYLDCLSLMARRINSPYQSIYNMFTDFEYWFEIILAILKVENVVEARDIISSFCLDNNFKVYSKLLETYQEYVAKSFATGKLPISNNIIYQLMIPYKFQTLMEKIQNKLGVSGVLGDNLELPQSETTLWFLNLIKEENLDTCYVLSVTKRLANEIINIIHTRYLNSIPESGVKIIDSECPFNISFLNNINVGMKSNSMITFNAPFIAFYNFESSSGIVVENRDLVKQLGKCEKRFISFPINIYYTEGSGHATTVLIDTLNKTIEYHDPNGYSRNTQEIFSTVQKVLENIFADYEVIFFDSRCPVRGPNIIKYKNYEGLCQLWSHLYLSLRILNPNIKRDEIMIYLDGLTGRKRDIFLTPYIKAMNSMNNLNERNILELLSYLG